MADSISRKDRKLQRRQNQLKGKEFKQEQQEKAGEEIKDMSASVATDARSSKLKSLSDAKKKEMLAEYEKVITKLKELELRNKKKQDFKFKFKDLKYFSTLNGHSVYSESMHLHAKEDKDSISAMMAYGQLGAGFDVSFEQFMVNVRPERRQEFLALCKNNPELSHNLMGMGKVLQFYNQRDFTRAYAAMVFFGLENNMDLMEKFLKVKFNADFKTQIETFKSQISNATVFEEKAIREEAGTNVFSQTDSISTAMESSVKGKSVAETIAEKAYSSKNIKEKSHKLVAPEMKNYKQIYYENETAQKLNLYEKAKAMFTTTAERREYIEKEKIELETLRAENKKLEFENKFSEFTSKLSKEENGNYKSSCVKKSYFSNHALQVLKDIQYFRNSQNTPNYSYSGLSNAERIEAAKATGNTALVEKIQEKAYIDIAGTSEEHKPTQGFEAGTIHETYLELNRQLQIVREAGNTAEMERLEPLVEQAKQKRDQLISENRKKIGGNDIRALLNVYKNDKQGLERVLSRFKEDLRSEGLSDKKIEELKTKIQAVEEALDELTRDPKGVARAAAEIQTTRLLDILKGEALFELSDLNLIRDVLDVESFNKLTGESLMPSEFQSLKENHFVGVFNIVDKKQLEELLMKKWGEIYKCNVANAVEGVSYQEIAEDMCNTLDDVIAELQIELQNIDQELAITTDASRKNELTEKKEEIESKIGLIEGSKEIIIRRKERTQNLEAKEQAKQEAKELKDAEKTIANAMRSMYDNLTTEIDGKRFYLDSLSPEERPAKIKITTMQGVVERVFGAIERIDALNLVSIKSENVSEIRNNLTRATRILDSIKGEISEDDFDALKARQEVITSKVEILESKASNKVIISKKSSEPEKIEDTTERSTDSQPSKAKPEKSSEFSLDFISAAKKEILETGSFASGSTKSQRIFANPENNGFEATLEEFKYNRKGLQRLLANYNKKLAKLIAAAESGEKIAELQERIKIIEEKISQLVKLNKMIEEQKLAEKGEIAQEQVQTNKEGVIVEILEEEGSFGTAPISGADALFEETEYPPKEPAGKTRLGAAKDNAIYEAEIAEIMAKGDKR